MKKEDDDDDDEVHNFICIRFYFVTYINTFHSIDKMFRFVSIKWALSES